ncbi:MAG: Selenide, water dikinase [Bacteroidia bacterium]|nr:Selenide, water dikinase [Bacteroidia bacterium]
MNTQIPESVKLTQYSHGAGCGCKISPATLSIILKTNEIQKEFPGLMVGNSSRDDAAVLDLGNGTALISTTDFFMPIVDNAFDFGRIAATNAISDVYAMGGKPVLAIAILGWPIDKLSPEIAGQVVAGGRAACEAAGIPLAGGHSIDCPEPVFGLAVNGIVETQNLKQNNTAQVGDILFLTKPLGVGILSTASKKGFLDDADREVSVKSMTALNKVGYELGKLKGVHALTDVTGFGLLGHAIEMAEGSGLTAEINANAVPLIPGLDKYLEKKSVPGGTNRNWASYGTKVSDITERTRQLLCDPQTSGGLLVAVSPDAVDEYLAVAKAHALPESAIKPIGKIISKGKFVVIIN